MSRSFFRNNPSRSVDLSQSRYMDNNKKIYHLASSNENIQLLVNKHTTELDKVLNTLKRDYDKMTLENTSKDKESDLIKKKIEMLEKRSLIIEKEFKEKRGQLTSLQSCSIIKQSTKQESNYDNQILKKTIDQLKKDIIIVQHDINFLINESARLDKRIEREQLNHHLSKSKSNKVYTQIVCKDMQNNYDENENMLQLGYFQEIINQKNSFIISADDRKVRQKMAAEQARKTPFDPNEIGSRMKIMMLKLYNHYLALKMSKQLKESLPLENALYEIKNECGTTKISDIIDVVLLKNKQYTQNQLSIEQLLIDQKELKSKLDVLKKKHQTILNNVVVTNIGEEDIRKIKLIKPKEIDENEDKLLMKEKLLKERLLSIQELRTEVNLEYNKVLMNINYLNHMYLIDNQKRKNKNEEVVIDLKKDQSITINESSIVNPNPTEESTIRKTEDVELLNEEDKAIKDYNTFLKNSYDTFNKLFLCYSKHDFIKSVREKNASKQGDAGKKLLKSNSMYPYGNHTSRAKKSKLCLSSSMTDLTANKKYSNNLYKIKDQDDNIIPAELNIQMQIMNSFLAKKKKEREDFLKQIQFNSAKPLMPMTTKH